jgi:hypothetical protein
MRKIKNVIKQLEGARVESADFYNSWTQKNVRSFTGTFLRFGESVYYGDAETHQVTVAIVLGEDMKIYLVPPNAITIVVEPNSLKHNDPVG